MFILRDTYQVVTGAPGSGKVGPLPPPRLLDLKLAGPACGFRISGATRAGGGWAVRGAPGPKTPGAAM